MTKTNPSPAVELARRLRELYGFDLTTVEKTNYGTSYARVKCSQCEALVINGVACHEPGCLNTREPDDADDDGD